jgi:DNA-binding response OmpR family regulator
MERETVLYISDQRSCSKAISVALNEAGFDVVATNRFTQAVALLYILRSVDAVVLQVREQATLDVRSVRAMCPDVPIVLLGRSQSYLLPTGADTYISAAQALTTLAAAIQHIVTSKPATRCPRRCGKAISPDPHHL